MYCQDVLLAKDVAFNLQDPKIIKSGVHAMLPIELYWVDSMATYIWKISRGELKQYTLSSKLYGRLTDYARQENGGAILVALPLISLKFFDPISTPCGCTTVFKTQMGKDSIPVLYFFSD